MKDQTKETSQL